MTSGPVTSSSGTPWGAASDQESVVPRYDESSLGAVLPGAALALGVDCGVPAVPLPTAARVCVVLVDGLGQALLEQSAASAPFLTTLLPTGRVLIAGCPTTTATSLGSFGTGLPPGRHGLVGYEVMDPARGVLLNELRWDPAVDPLVWQPHRTVFQRLIADGVPVTQIGNREFAGSGLTRAAMRGGDFAGIDALDERVDRAVELLARPGPGLVYLYWGAVDTAGHRDGWQSRAWRQALRRIDRELARLAARLGPGTLLLITADHGMVDVPHAGRTDLADRPDLAAGIGVLGGEARFGQLYTPNGAGTGAAAELAAVFAAALGDRAWVRTRDQAIADGWFGAVDPWVHARIGDVLVASRGPTSLIDSRTARPEMLALIGQHGSLTPAEQTVPLLVARS